MYRPKQSPVFSIRCSCCLRSKYMRELLDKDCADITDPQSYAETWLSFPSPDGSRKNGGEINEPSLRTADVSPRPSPLRDVSRGEKSATQRQKFHTDDAKSVRNPVRSANWSTEFLLVNRPSASHERGETVCRSQAEKNQFATHSNACQWLLFVPNRRPAFEWVVELVP